MKMKFSTVALAADALCRAFADFFFCTSRHIDWDRATPDTDISATLRARPQAIFGPRATGPTIPVITGSLASGSFRRESDSCGPQDTGATTAAIISSTTATGARPSGSTAEINYGYGYGGHGYYGGRWVGNTFRYNTAVTRVNTSVIHNTYFNRQVVNNNRSRASFNGPGGTTAKPTAKEQAAAKAEHIPATSAQQSRVEAAKNNPDLHAANNQREA